MFKRLDHSQDGYIEVYWLKKNIERLKNLEVSDISQEDVTDGYQTFSQSETGNIVHLFSELDHDNSGYVSIFITAMF